MNSSGRRPRIGKKQPLLVRLRTSLAALDDALADFLDGKARSVSGNESGIKLGIALVALHEIEKELSHLFPLDRK